MIKSVSIVIPLYNEEKTISHLFSRLNKLATKLPSQTEVILVNDGSVDNTEKLLTKTKLNFKKRIITFSRNFGHQAAIFAGLEASGNEVVVTMDGDLQHPPELIADFIALHNQGYDIVLTNRIDTKQLPLFKRLTSKWFYTIINLLSSTPVPVNSSDFRSMNRRSLNALLAMSENRKFLRGMVGWIGFKNVIIPFEIKNRIAGHSKYSGVKMLKLALHGITSFSVVPLYISALVSLILFIATTSYGLYVLYARLVTGKVVEGWTSVMLVVLMLGSIITLFLGFFGVYIAAIFDEVKKRPNYIEKK